MAKLYEDAMWQQVAGPDVEPFVQQVNPIDNTLKINAESAQVAWRPVPFYQTAALIRAFDTTWPAGRGPVWFLAQQGRMFRLNGLSAPIHEVNDLAPIKVTEENVLDYLKFFCFFVHGDEGPFTIVEELSDIEFTGEPDETQRNVIQGALHAATYNGKTKEGNFAASGVVLYGNALFEAQFSIMPDGMIEMTDDEPIAADLPIKKPLTK